MKVSKNVQIIGLVETIAWLPTGHKNIRSQHAYNSNIVLASNRSGTILYLFPGELNESYQVEFKIPTRNLKKIGTAKRIIYTSELWEGVEDLYHHNFRDATIYGNRLNKPLVLAIKNKTGKIVDSEEGII